MKNLMYVLKSSRTVCEVNIKDISQVAKWKGNVNHKSPTEYLEELKYYFKTLGIDEDDRMNIISTAMVSSAEGWFRLIKDKVYDYRDFLGDVFEEVRQS